MPDLLLELFSEEIPARMQAAAAKDLERLVVGALSDRGLMFEGVKAFAGDAAAKPPLRMGIFTVTGGTVIESWKSKTAGALGKLPSILRPLEFAKDDMLLITGLGNNARSVSRATGSASSRP